jgi:acyl carrier protein
MHWTLLLLPAAIAFVAFTRYEGWRKNCKIEAAFAGRSSLSPAEFYERFFRAQGIPEEIVVGVRKVLEEQLGADLSRLIAPDDFTQNIGFFFEFDSMADVEIICALEKEFSIKISNKETMGAHTIQSIVDLVWRKIQASV